MGATLAQITALLFSAAILLMGHGLQTTLLPIRAQIQAFSTYDIGILGSAYYVGFAAGCLLGPHLIRRVGHIRAFTAMVAIASTAPLGHSLFLDPSVWWPVRAVTGFCLATLFMIIESWLNEKANNNNRGVVFSIYTIINLTVMTLGQLMINLYDLGSFALFTLASMMVSLAAVPLALTKASAPAPVKTVKVRLGHLYRLSPIAVVGAFITGIQQGAFWSLGPVFADRIGLTTASITIFMSVTVIGGALGQWPVGRLSDKLDRRYVLIGLCLIAAAIGITIRFLTPSQGHGIFFFATVYGAATFPIYAICAAHMNDHVSEGGFVEASSGLLLVFAAGAIIGPLAASPIMAVMNAYGLFSLTAFIQALLAIYAVTRLRARAAVPEEARTPFVESLRATNTVSPIGSRTEDGGAPATTAPAGNAPETVDEDARAP